jgi:creatinine amidohydrolase/Fe(II)-dependent formamide hydrolase-like protein
VIARDPRLIIPVGTCESHGPHMPLGCDSIIVEQLADDLSAEFGVLRAPLLEYGGGPQKDRQLGGGAVLRRKTLHGMLNDLLDHWEDQGVGEFIMLTAHGPDAHLEALETVVTSGARVRVVDVLAVDMTDLLEAQREPLHGDEVDTSLLLHLAPHLVRLELAQDYTVASGAGRWSRREGPRIPSASAGSIGTPSAASAAKGAILYRRIREQVAQHVFRAPAVVD